MEALRAFVQFYLTRYSDGFELEPESDAEQALIDIAREEALLRGELGA